MNIIFDEFETLELLAGVNILLGLYSQMKPVDGVQSERFQKRWAFFENLKDELEKEMLFERLMEQGLENRKQKCMKNTGILIMVPKEETQKEYEERLSGYSLNELHDLILAEANLWTMDSSQEMKISQLMRFLRVCIRRLDNANGRRDGDSET